MLVRQAFVWDVQLGSSSGQVVDTTFTSYWSPDRVDSSEIAHVAAIQYNAENSTQLMPISAALRAAE